MTITQRQPTANTALYIFFTVGGLIAVAVIFAMLSGAMKTTEGALFGTYLGFLVLLGIGLFLFNVDDVRKRASPVCMKIFVAAVIPLVVLTVLATIAGGGAIR